MKKISIISHDARFLYANSHFIKSGYDSKICILGDKRETDILVLPVKNSFSDEELTQIAIDFDGIKKVFSGSKERLKGIFDADIYDYSEDETFIDENAYLTAECALKIAFENLDKSMSDSKIAVLGYGRIGAYFTKMLTYMNAKTFVYARRDVSKAKAKRTGAFNIELDDIKTLSPDMVFNTVPNVIVEKHITDLTDKNTIFVELASAPGGFEDTSRVKSALALPGKYLPKSAGKAISDFVLRTLREAEE